MSDTPRQVLIVKNSSTVTSNEIKENLLASRIYTNYSAEKTNYTWIASGWDSVQFLEACKNGWTLEKGWPKQMIVNDIIGSLGEAHD